jgi:hypothetical protein
VPQRGTQAYGASSSIGTEIAEAGTLQMATDKTRKELEEHFQSAVQNEDVMGECEALP